MKKYYIITSKLEIENEEITVYGIGCTDNKIRPIYNISTSRSAIEELVKTINKEDLAPIHMQDVCEDILD